ncbi:uncharacterized protein C8Q71DRAFT_138211 [Rhodofomes roseus]|uniref:Uncharacterized protein n=1 Tax=Rhodofomes roseus TaxID=34475 RepID=A0ABQ8KDA2_9APHY|nr:uncharacterized protein C8Q71DRAFT_138211 [Rhodofomes roseus]KAH9835031.1 hypothetical protein C8Q71DRAFT_138211 [Rhodofomes roseus]
MSIALPRSRQLRWSVQQLARPGRAARPHPQCAHPAAVDSRLASVPVGPCHRALSAKITCPGCVTAHSRVSMYTSDCTRRIRGRRASRWTRTRNLVTPEPRGIPCRSAQTCSRTTRGCQGTDTARRDTTLRAHLDVQGPVRASGLRVWSVQEQAARTDCDQHARRIVVSGDRLAGCTGCCRHVARGVVTNERRTRTRARGRVLSARDPRENYQGGVL